MTSEETAPAVDKPATDEASSYSPGKQSQHLAYWLEHLDGILACLDLPTDYPRSTIRQHRHGRVDFALPSELGFHLRKAAQYMETDPFVILLAAFQVLLFRYTGQEDFVLGLSISDGLAETYQSVIKRFEQMLPLRINLADDPPFGEFLRSVKVQMLEFQAHREILLKLLQRQPERLSHSDTATSQISADLQGVSKFMGTAVVQKTGEKSNTAPHPPFQETFEIHHLPAYSPPLADFHGPVLHQSDGAIQVDLAISIVDTNRDIHGWIDYECALFEEATIQRLITHFTTLLAGIIAVPEQHLSQLPLLSSEEWQQIVVQWNSTASPQPLDRCLFQLFEDQVRRTPEATALLYGEKHLTYAELNRRANRLAHMLHASGVRPDMLVGVLLERSLDFVVALLAIAKAGGAFLPLEVRQTTQLHAQILRQSQSRLIISAAPFALHLEQIMDDLSVDDWPEVLTLETLQWQGDWDGNLSLSVSPAHLAYVMFTSGSTGKPKGAMVEQRGMLNHIYGKLRDLQICATDIIAQIGPSCFDIVVWQCLAALIVGGKTCIIRDEVVSDPMLLLETLEREQITVLQLVPALLRALVQAARITSPVLKSLRWVVPTGDALPFDLCQQWLEMYPAIPLLNTYGSTECSDDQCHFVINRLSQETATPIMPLGKPIGNLQTFILDKCFQLVPVGVPGELYIGGIGVGRGYLNDPYLTNQRFLPHPFSTVPGARLYRTGDRARYRPDGTIEFLGRLDFMVKVRGFRIELDEIEAALRKHPYIEDCIVVVQKQGEDADGCLVAYIVTKEDYTPYSNDLRTFLGKHLPEHMHPTLFAPLKHLPLNSNGKIERKALPDPRTLTALTTTPYVPPTNDIEKHLQTIWSDVLQVPLVGMHDNFFDLGGHSLLAVQIMLRISSTFHVRLSLSSLFEAPTIAGLATKIARWKINAAVSIRGEHFREAFPEVTASISQRYEPFLLTDLQQAYWVGQTNFFELGNISAHTFTEFDCIDLDVQAALHALHRLIERHDMLRVLVRPDGMQQVLEKVPTYQVELVDLRNMTPLEQEQHLQAVRTRMSLHGPRTDMWPLFELCAHQITDRRIRLHVSISLLLMDAQTEQLLACEWLQHYHHPEKDFKPLAVTYRDYLVAFQTLGESKIGEQAWQYWKNRLATLPAAPEFPLLNATPAHPLHFVRRKKRLGVENWKRLKMLAHHAGLTPNSVLCTAYAEVIAKWSKSQHFSLNILISNRLPLHKQVNEIVGNLATPIPLEIDCRAPLPFIDRCRILQRQLWDDIDHSQVSGIRCVREAARAQGWTPRVAMPVVFASSLDLKIEREPHALNIEEVYGALQTAQVLLDHQVFEEGSDLILIWDAIDALFPSGLVDVMFEAYSQLLDLLASSASFWREKGSLAIPTSPVASLTELTCFATCDEEGLLHTPFLRQATLRPSNPAIITINRQLSYDEVLRRSLKVTWWLQQHQAAPNTLVGVVMEKGWEQVVAVLGILEAGVAYLPVDPQVPPSRLSYILEHAGATLVLTQSRIEKDTLWPEAIQRYTVDTDEPVLGEYTLPVRLSRSEDIAYVIYTSGSTGHPKGVAIEHRSVVNTIADLNKRFHLTPDDRVLALSALNFDLSVYDIFGTLAAGAAIVMPDMDRVKEPAHWLELLSKARVTIWNSVPALMELLIEQMSHQHLPLPLALRLVFLSGDWIPVSLPDRIRAFMSGTQIISMGGATEASIWSILYPIEQIQSHWVSIPYGRGMLNQEVYVLDAALRPRPAWATGNLYIAGAGLARGYWHDEEKTRASFVTHPESGIRLYRTGDLGRYLPDGNIEFLGREDFQIKLQGYRIELGEIEAVLARHPAVKNALVSIYGNGADEKFLVAYVILHEGKHTTSNDLRHSLLETLPAYMVPGIFMFLESLPLTANGKIDRRSLPEPVSSRSTLTVSANARPGVLEKQLIGIWESILHMHPISIEDNFFELGGNSFTALRLTASIRKQLGYDLSLSTLFQGITIKRLARLLNEREKVFYSSPLVCMQTTGEKSPFFYIHPVGGNVLCYIDLVRHLGQERPFYGCASIGLHGEQEPYTSIPDMATRYIEEICKIQSRGPYYLGGWSMGGIIAFEMAQQLSHAGMDVASVILIDSDVPVPEQSSSLIDETAMLVRFAHDMGGFLFQSLLSFPTNLHQDSLAEQYSNIRTYLRQYGIIAPDMEGDDLRRLFPIFQANTNALANYVAKPYSGQIALLQASTSIGKEHAWQRLAPQITVFQIPANHYTLLKEPVVKVLASYLRDLLR